MAVGKAAECVRAIRSAGKSARAGKFAFSSDCDGEGEEEAVQAGGAEAEAPGTTRPAATLAGTQEAAAAATAAGKGGQRERKPGDEAKAADAVATGAAYYCEKNAAR